MSELYDHLLEEVFLAFLNGRPPATSEDGLSIVEDAFTFTLPTLFRIARKSYEETGGGAIDDDRATYLAFRKELYGQPTNQWLSQRGGRIEIAEANHDHDLTRYRLARVHKVPNRPTP